MATTRTKIPIYNNHHLPEEIVEEEILTRLPVKSLVRLRSVCKTWQTLIASPNFIKSHLNCTFINPNNDSILVKRLSNPTRNQYEIASLSRMDPNLWDNHILHPIDSSFIQLLGSINGLVGLCRIDKLCEGLLGKGVLVRFWLWNPATKQCKAIPPLRNNYIQSVGFGFDSVANDFKFVCINDSHHALRSLQTLEGDVYSSRSDSWNNEVARTDFSEVAETDFKVRWYFTNRTTIVNGCPYWRDARFSNFGYVVFFYKFEVRNEKLRLLPELHFARHDQITWRAENIKDSLATLVYYSPGKGLRDRFVDDSLVDVYIFDERCELWCKAYTVGPLAFELPIYRTRLQQCFKNGDIVFQDDEGNVFLYELKNKAIKGLRDSEWCLSDGMRYTESLVFVEGMELLREENKPLKN